MNIQFPKISQRPLNLMEIPCQKAFNQISKSQHSFELFNSRKTSKQICLLENLQNSTSRRKNLEFISQTNQAAIKVANLPSSNFSCFHQNISPRTEKYRLHIDSTILEDSFQIPHFNKKGPQKYPLFLSKIASPNRRVKTETNDDSVQRIQHHFSIQTVKKRQQKLVQNIQSLIESLNSSQDQKLCLHFDKLKHDLKLDDISTD